MKIPLLTFLFALTVSASHAAQQGTNHQALVAQIKAEVIAQGIDIAHGPGECGRFEITKRVVKALEHEGFGHIAKFAAQNGCSATNTTSEPKYAVDAGMYRDGTGVDFLCGSPTGPNTPCWNVIANPINPSLWRAPVFQGNVPPPPPPPTPPPVEIEPRVEALERWADELVDEIQRLTERLRVTEDNLARINEVFSTQLNEHATSLQKLQARPVPVECRASVLGINISCKLLTVINP